MTLRNALAGVAARPLPRIHVLSDVHLETGPYELDPALEFDVLVAAGDIGPVDVAVPWLVSLGKPVVYVLGNHERWGMDFNGAVRQAKELAAGSRVHVLERESVTVAGVRFVGATLWTDLFEARPTYISAVWNFMRDYGYITCDEWMTDPKNVRDLDKLRKKLQYSEPSRNDEGRVRLHPLVTLIEHRRTVAWLKKTLRAKSKAPTVVVSHHAPSFESLRRNGVREELLEPRRWGMRDEEPARVAAYASDLLKTQFEPRQLSSVAMWVHGHTHRAMQYIENGIHVVCNPRGRHSKPLTMDSAQAYRMFGVSFSAQDVERSQAAHREQPWKGDGWEFERNLVIDFTSPRERAVALACAKPLERLEERLDELRTWVSVACKGRDARRLAVTRCTEECLKAICADVELAQSAALSAFDKVGRPGILSRLPEIRTPQLESSKGFGHELVVSDFKRALSMAEEAVAAVRELPGILTRHLQDWARMSLLCVDALAAAGMKASAVARSPRAFWISDKVEVELCLPEAPASEDEQEALRGIVEALLEKTLNPNGPPRRWLPRVYYSRAEAPRRLVSRRALQTLADAE